MKKTSLKRERIEIDEIWPEYDFSRSRPNKYAARYAEGTNLVLIDPEIYRMFRTQRAVNDALRLVIKLRKLTAK